MQILRISPTNSFFKILWEEWFIKSASLNLNYGNHDGRRLLCFKNTILPHFSSFLECCEEKKISLWESGDFCYCSTRLNCRWYERRLGFKFTKAINNFSFEIWITPLETSHSNDSQSKATLNREFFIRKTSPNGAIHPHW